MPKQVKNTAEIGKQGGRSNLGCLATASLTAQHQYIVLLHRTGDLRLLLRITRKVQTLGHLEYDDIGV